MKILICVYFLFIQHSIILKINFENSLHNFKFLCKKFIFCKYDLFILIYLMCLEKFTMSYLNSFLSELKNNFCLMLILIPFDSPGSFEFSIIFYPKNVLGPIWFFNFRGPVS